MEVETSYMFDPWIGVQHDSPSLQQLESSVVSFNNESKPSGPLAV
jgi:hypothetical protein